MPWGPEVGGAAQAQSAGSLAAGDSSQDEAEDDVKQITVSPPRGGRRGAGSAQNVGCGPPGESALPCPVALPTVDGWRPGCERWDPGTTDSLCPETPV